MAGGRVWRSEIESCHRKHESADRKARSSLFSIRLDDRDDQHPIESGIEAIKHPIAGDDERAEPRPDIVMGTAQFRNVSS